MTIHPVEERTENYLRRMVQRHEADPEFRVEFACCYALQNPGRVELIEVSRAIFDPEDASFDAVSLGTPLAEAGISSVGIRLVSPAEFDHAWRDSATNGGRLLRALRASAGSVTILAGENSRFAEVLGASPVSQPV